MNIKIANDIQHAYGSIRLGLEDLIHRIHWVYCTFPQLFSSPK